MTADLADQNRARRLTITGLALEVSQYLRSVCCDAPLAQTYEYLPDVYPVSCVACGRQTGAPGGEDVEP